MTLDDPRCKYFRHWRMATAIIDLTHRNGGCAAQDLLAFGFTSQETKELWPLSHVMAAIELKNTPSCLSFPNTREVSHA